MIEHDPEPGALTRRLDALNAWTSRPPPPGFADTVLEAHARQELRSVEPSSSDATPSPPARPRWRRAAQIALATVAAAALLVLVWPARVPGTTGSFVAEARQTVPLSQRAIAVAEPGASLRWTETTDALVVDQRDGAVFYRVESGDPFLVRTPAGEVRVTGTCFSVAVDSTASPSLPAMKPNTKSIALGAALAAAVTVTVYEGSTVLANDSGRVALEAGQTGRATAGTPPSIDDAPGSDGDSATAPADATELATLRAHTQSQARELDRLRQRLHATTDPAAAAEPGHDDPPPPRRFGYNGPPLPEGFDYYAPSQAALLEMAECGVVAWDQPPVWADDEQPDPQYLDALGLSDDEATAFREVFDQFRTDTTQTASDFWVELGGAPEAAAAIDPSELLGLVYGRSDFDDRERGRIQLAMERAGLAEHSSGELSTTERLLRWDADLGNAFERALAERLGPERAQSLRASRGGWSGKRSTWADVCSDR